MSIKSTSRKEISAVHQLAAFRKADDTIRQLTQTANECRQKQKTQLPGIELACLKNAIKKFNQYKISMNIVIDMSGLSDNEAAELQEGTLLAKRIFRKYIPAPQNKNLCFILQSELSDNPRIRRPFGSFSPEIVKGHGLGFQMLLEDADKESDYSDHVPAKGRVSFVEQRPLLDRRHSEYQPSPLRRVEMPMSPEQAS